MIEGPVSSLIPASALQLHPWTIAISEPRAAGKLQLLSYYQHVDRETRDQPVLPPWIERPELDPPPTACGLDAGGRRDEHGLAGRWDPEQSPHGYSACSQRGLRPQPKKPGFFGKAGLLKMCSTVRASYGLRL